MRSWMLCGFMLLLTGCYGGEIKELQETVVAQNDNLVTMNDNVTTLSNGVQQVINENKTRFDTLDQKVGKVSVAVDDVKTSVDAGNSTLANLKREQAEYLERVGETIARSVKDVVPSDEKLVEKAKEGFRAAKREAEEEAAAKAKAEAEAEAAKEAAAQDQAARIRRILGVSPTSDENLKGIRTGLRTINTKVDKVQSRLEEIEAARLAWIKAAEREHLAYMQGLEDEGRTNNFTVEYLDGKDAATHVPKEVWRTKAVKTKVCQYNEYKLYLDPRAAQRKCYVQRRLLPFRSW